MYQFWKRVSKECEIKEDGIEEERKREPRNLRKRRKSGFILTFTSPMTRSFTSPIVARRGTVTKTEVGVNEYSLMPLKMRQHE